MASYTVWECDRCGRQEQSTVVPDHWYEDSRLFDLTVNTCCEECAKSINDWFAAGKTPHRKRGPRTKKQETTTTTTPVTYATK